jgi:hypothetical protein
MAVDGMAVDDPLSKTKTNFYFTIRQVSSTIECGDLKLDFRFRRRARSRDQPAPAIWSSSECRPPPDISNYHI